MDRMAAPKSRYDFNLAERCRKAYHLTIDAVREAARERGYAIAVHGSLSRDIDLVAVPWTDEAVSPHELAEAVRAAAEKSSPFRIGLIGPRGSVRKPHGRLAWSIHLGGGPYIDLSVIPPRN